MLTEQQLAQFEEEGYLLLSGLIPQETVTKAREAMWHLMGMDADNPDSWEDCKHSPASEFYMQRAGARTELFGVTHPDVMACCTPEYLTLSLSNSPPNTQRSHIVKSRVLRASGHSINSPFQPSGKDRRPI